MLKDTNTDTDRINEILSCLSTNQPFIYLDISLSTLINNEKLVDIIVITLDEQQAKICVLVNKKVILDFDSSSSLWASFYSEIKKRIKGGQTKVDSIAKQFEKKLIKYIIDNEHIATTKSIENLKFLNHFHEIIDKMPQLTPEIEKYFERLKNAVKNDFADDSNFNFDLFDENNASIEELERFRQDAMSSSLVSILPNSVHVFGTDINEKFPKQVELAKELFQILETYEKNESLMVELETIANVFNMPEHTKDKFLAYFKVKRSNVSPLLLSESDENDMDETNSSSSEIENDEIDIKNLDQLLDELKFIDFDESITKESLKNDCAEIDRIFEAECKNMNKSEIKEWFLSHRKEQKQLEINKSIAIMSRANELATKGGNKRQRLRMTQKLAILIFLKTNGNKGHIIQISTGEGKTTIISIISALKVLQGFKVHVITTNPILAAEGVKTRERFFKILGLSVDHNNPEEAYKSGARKCYKCDVVYGCMSSFQFDWLRHTFERLETMGTTDFSSTWLMIDEIDSLLIDQGSNMAKLSAPFPGMECLRYVYINIWIRLIKAEGRVSEEIKKELDDFCKKLNNKDEDNQIKYENKIAELSENYLDRIRTKLTKNKDKFYKKEFVSQHLVSFVERNLEKWMECALDARFKYQNNVEYKITKQVVKCENKEKMENIIEEDVIVPIDNQNTGVSLSNTILSNGLHQFLQLKHGVNLTYESLTSCFVSNLGYVRKYKNKISGVTGTLGSTPERTLLGSVFELNFSVVPTYKRKVFYQFPGRVLEDDKFNNLVGLAALREVKRGFGEKKLSRAVLLICDSIKSADAISKEIREEAEKTGLNRAPDITRYTDESEADIVDRVIKPNEIIIATNISGRGTDLRTHESLEENGGLHVILAFLPCNQRVQDQGMGRTSRQGNRGTGQIFAKLNEVQALGLSLNSFDLLAAQNFDKILDKRNECESDRLRRIKDKKIEHLKFLDCLFEKFSSEYSRIKYQCRYIEVDDEKDNLKRWYALQDLKEKWAFWLDEKGFLMDESTKSRSLTLIDVQSQFEEFLSASKGIQNEEIDHNPFYSICLANEYLERENSVKNRDRAQNELENALKLGNYYNQECFLLYPAYVKLFEVEFENGCQMYERYKRAFEDILLKMPDFNNYISLFKTCLELLKNAVESLKNDKGLDEQKKALKKKLDEAVTMMTDYLSNLKPDKLVEIGEKIKKLLKDLEEFIRNLIKNINRKYIENGLEQLKKARQGLEAEKDYLEMLMRSTKEDEKKPSPIEIIVSNAQNVGEENFLIKHLVSRHICLCVYLENIKSLEEQAETFVSTKENGLLAFDKFGDPVVRKYLNKTDIDNKEKKEGGLMIGSRVSGYLSKLDSNYEQERKLKEHITEIEVKELEQVGIKTIYQLRIVYNVSGEIIDYARGQILIGLSIFGIGIPFPFLLPICEKLGSMFISEGITDIVMALVNQGYTDFDRKAYVKSKAIAYAIHMVTMGIGAILSNAKFLTKVMNACRSLADKLRRIHGPFHTICQFLAKWLDRFADFLEKVIEKIEFSRKSLEEKQCYLARLKDAGKTDRFVELEKIYKTTAKTMMMSSCERVGTLIFASTLGTLKNLATSICLDKTVNWCLNAILEDLKPHIEKYVSAKVDKFLEKLDISLLNKLKSIDMKKYEELLFKKLFDTSLIDQLQTILKQASLNILKQSGDWRVKLALLSMETLLSASDIFECVEKILNRYVILLEELSNSDKFENEDNYKRIIESLKKSTTEIIYARILFGLVNVIKTIPRIFIERKKRLNEKNVDERKAQLMDTRQKMINRANNAIRDKNCVHDATANNLGISNDQLSDATGLAPSERGGASIQDSKNMCETLGIKTSEYEGDNIEEGLRQHNSDRSIMFFEYPNGEKHAVSCFERDGQLFVQDGDQITTLAEYKQTNACESVKFLIYENVNESSLNDYHVRINIRRIENATGSISFTGEMNEELYGTTKRLRSKPVEEQRHYEGAKYIGKLERSDIRISEIKRGSLTRVGQDEYKRVVFTEAHITAEHIGTGERKGGMEKYREPGLDDAGHDVACVLGGTADKYNMFAQNASINRGAYKQVENFQREWIELGSQVGANHSVLRQCERYYESSCSTAPISLAVHLEYLNNGEVMGSDTYWFPNVPGAIYVLNEYGEFVDIVDILANLRY